MKTVLVELASVTPGDLVILQYRSPRGGRTHVMHRVRPGEDAAAVLRELGTAIGKDWMPEHFQARLNLERGVLSVNCSDLVSDVKFSSDVEGPKSPAATTVKITEF